MADFTKMYNYIFLIAFLFLGLFVILILYYLLAGRAHEWIDIPIMKEKDMWINRKHFEAPHNQFRLKEEWKE